MKIYFFDEKTLIYVGWGYAQINPIRKGEYLYPKNSTTIEPPNLKQNETAIFKGSFWKVIPDYRGAIQINILTGETSTVNKVGELEKNYRIFSEYTDTAEYKILLKKLTDKNLEFNIHEKIRDLDNKRIRAICEPAIKNKTTGESWLDYYNAQISDLRNKLKEIKYDT